MGGPVLPIIEAKIHPKGTIKMNNMEWVRQRTHKHTHIYRNKPLNREHL